MDRDSVAKIAQQCNMYDFPSPLCMSHVPISKRESAKLAQEQSAHLFLCLLISDLTTRYGPVVRQARVVGVLDAAFDVIVPEFGIEKRVHVDQMPIDVSLDLRVCTMHADVRLEPRLRRSHAWAANLLVHEGRHHLARGEYGRRALEERQAHR